MADKAIRAEDTSNTAPVRVIGATFYDVWTLNGFDKTYELYRAKELGHELAAIDAARNTGGGHSPVQQTVATKFMAQLTRRFAAAMEAADDANFLMPWQTI